jgi:hypothetical protein
VFVGHGPTSEGLSPAPCSPVQYRNQPGMGGRIERMSGHPYRGRDAHRLTCVRTTICRALFAPVVSTFGYRRETVCGFVPLRGPGRLLSPGAGRHLTWSLVRFRRGHREWLDRALSFWCSFQLCQNTLDVAAGHWASRRRPHLLPQQPNIRYKQSLPPAQFRR